MPNSKQPLSIRFLRILFLGLVTIVMCLSGIAWADNRLKLTNAEQNYLESVQTIRMGAMDNWPPFNFLDHQGRPTGIGADLVAELNHRLGDRLTIVSAPWKELYEQVKTGELDALLDITQTPEREKFFNFTTPYLRIPHVIVAPKDVPFIGNIGALSGKRVAMEKEFFTIAYLKAHYPEIIIREYRDTSHCLEAVECGEADAYLGNRAVATYVIKQELLQNLKVHGRDETRPGSVLSIGTRVNRSMLRNILQKALNDIDAKTFNGILARWTGEEHWQIALTAEEQEFVKTHPVIRVSNELDWPPFDFAVNGMPQGYSIDLSRLLAKRLGLTLQFINGYTWPELVEMFKKGEIDILHSLKATEDRRRFGLFTDNYFRYTTRFATLKGQPEIQSVAQLKNKIIAMPKGYAEEIFLKKNYPDIETIAVTSTKEAFEAILSGRADVSIINDAVGRYLINKNQFDELLISGWFKEVDQRNDNGLHFMVQKQMPQLAAMFNKALATVTPGEIFALEKKWFGEQEPGSGKKTTKISLTAQEQDWIAKHAGIRVHNELDWPPFNYNRDGVPLGYSIDVMNLIAQKTGLEVKYITGPIWNDFLNMMKSGDLDVMLNIMKTPDRDKYLLFTPSYVENPNTILSRRNFRYENISQLFGKTIAIPKGFFHEEILRRDYPRINLLMVNHTLDAMKAVSFGQADASVGRSAVFNYLLNEHMLTDLIVSAELKIGNDEYPRLNIATRKDLPMLASILSKGVKSISPQEKQALQVKWLQIARIPVSSPGPEQIRLSPAEETWLAGHKKIRLGIDPDWPPFEQTRPDGGYGGIASDYVARLNDGLKIHMEPLLGLAWTKVIDKARAGELDVIPCIARTPKREEFLVFTKPYIRFQSVIVTGQKAHFVNGLEDLSGRRVGVVHAYITHEKIATDYPDIHLVTFKTVDEGLKELDRGNLDAFVDNLASITMSIRRQELENVKVASTTEYTFELAFGVRKDWPQLVPILEKGLAAISRQERATIHDRWINIFPEMAVDWSVVWQAVSLVIAVLGSILITVLMWNRRLGREVVERKRAETELRKFSRAIDQSQVSVVITDPSGMIEYVNPKFLAVTGYSREEVVGQNPRILNSGTHPDAMFKNMWETITKGGVWAGELVNKKKNGELFWENTVISPIRDAKAEISNFVAVKEDVTERKHMEKETLEAKERAETAARVKSDFLARMSHEIRTPMNAILGMSELLAETTLDFDQRDYIQTLQSSGEMLLVLINDILDFSKIEAGHVELEAIGFDLYDLVEEVSRVLLPKAREKNLEIAHHVASALPHFLTGDPTRLTQILVNLVGNAVKFTQKGSITLEVSSFDDSDQTDMVLFTVKDTGQGIPRDKQELIFDRFSQADDSITRKFGGTGLGLTICKLLVELMGGRIWVASEINKGATFSFTVKLPEAKQAVARSISALEPGFNHTTVNKRILVIDDNATNRLLLHDHLTRWGAQVDLAESGEQGLKEIEQSEKTGSPYDIIFLDVVMDGMDGIEVAAKIKQRHPMPPAVIIATSSDRVSDKAQAKALGVEGYLAKPIRRQDLIKILLEVSGDNPDELLKTGGPQKQKIMLGPMTILLVEDIPANRKVIHQYLKEFPVTIVDAENGADALEKIASRPFDLVLMDREMPVMDGLQATRTIRKNEGEKGLTRMPVVELTAHAFGSDRETSLKAGCDDFLTKPVKKDDILNVLFRYQKKIPPEADRPGVIEKEAQQMVAVRQQVKISKDMADLIPEFFEEIREEIQKMLTALEQKDFKTLKRLAHGYKGASASYELNYLSKLFSGVESAADATDMDAIRAELYSVADYIDKIEVEFI